MPIAKNGLLIGLALGAGMLAGCSTTKLEPALAPEPAISPMSSLGEDVAMADASRSRASGIVLPEEVAVLPSSYAGPTPGDGSYQVAALSTEPVSLPPADGLQADRIPAVLTPDNPARDVFPEPPEARTPDEPAGDIVWAPPQTPRGDVDRLIAKYASYYEVPEKLVRRVVKRESNFNPAARNGPYWGLMQILPQTAKGMGYQGAAQGLLDAETNLKYAVKYLRGAYITADGDHDQAVRFYARGYYYDAKRRGLLEETGLGKDRKRKRQNSV